MTSALISKWNTAVEQLPVGTWRRMERNWRRTAKQHDTVRRTWLLRIEKFETLSRCRHRDQPMYREIDKDTAVSIWYIIVSLCRLLQKLALCSTAGATGLNIQYTATLLGGRIYDSSFIWSRTVDAVAGLYRCAQVRGTAGSYRRAARLFDQLIAPLPATAGLPHVGGAILHRSRVKWFSGFQRQALITVLREPPGRFRGVGGGVGNYRRASMCRIAARLMMMMMMLLTDGREMSVNECQLCVHRYRTSVCSCRRIWRLAGPLNETQSPSLIPPKVTQS